MPASPRRWRPPTRTAPNAPPVHQRIPAKIGTSDHCGSLESCVVPRHPAGSAAGVIARMLDIPALIGQTWPLVSLLPIAANSWTGQVLSRPSSRVRSPGSLTGAVALRSQTALTGSDRPRTIRQREQGRPAATDETCCRSSGPGFMLFAPADRRWRRRSGSGSGSEGERAVAAARAARRAALKPYRKFSHRLGDNRWWHQRPASSGTAPLGPLGPLGPPLGPLRAPSARRCPTPTDG